MDNGGSTFNEDFLDADGNSIIGGGGVDFDKLTPIDIQNVTVGLNALANNVVFTTLRSLAAFGNQTTGGQNVGVGFTAGINNKSGSSNTYIGNSDAVADLKTLQHSATTPR